jgi:hypothetical protein
MVAVNKFWFAAFKCEGITKAQPVLLQPALSSLGIN